MICITFPVEGVLPEWFTTRLYHLIQCLNKIALLDSTCTLMGDSNIDLLKSPENNVPSKFLEIITSCFLFHLFSNGHTQVKNLSKKRELFYLRILD